MRIKYWSAAVRTTTVLLLTVVLVAPAAFAQSGAAPQGNGFRISPVRSELVIDKGRSEVVTITVENPATVPVEAQPFVNNFLPGDDESGTPRIILDDNVLPPARDFKRLVQPIDNVTVPASDQNTAGKVDVDVIISVPSDAPSGGYYGAIRFVPVLPGLDGDNVALTASVGTIFLITVPGDLRQQLDLVQLSAAEGDNLKGFFIGGDVNIGTRLRNTGDIHVQPFGKIQIHDFFGNQVYEFEFNDIDPRSNVLPDSTRKFINEIPQQSWFGRYTITANIGFSQGSGDLLIGKAAFWYFSTLVFYAMLFGLLVVVGGVYWLVRHYKKARRKKGKHPY